MTVLETPALRATSSTAKSGPVRRTASTAAPTRSSRRARRCSVHRGGVGHGGGVRMWRRVRVVRHLLYVLHGNSYLSARAAFRGLGSSPMTVYLPLPCRLRPPLSLADDRSIVR